jgi:uncharacterized protein YciI
LKAVHAGKFGYLSLMMNANFRSTSGGWMILSLIAALGAGCGSSSEHAASGEFWLSLAGDSVDAYGMKPYVLAMLQTADTKPRPQDELKAVFDGHMNNIERLAEEGKLLVAGPFYGIDKVPGSWRGLFVLNTSDTAEARSWVQSDPAVQAGVFRVELAPWYSSGALQAVNAIHESLDAKSHAD